MRKIELNQKLKSQACVVKIIIYYIIAHNLFRNPTSDVGIQGINISITMEISTIAEEISYSFMRFYVLVFIYKFNVKFIIYHTN